MHAGLCGGFHMDEKEIWRSADLTIHRYAGQAEFIACGRIDDMISVGDQAGEAVWKQILVAIKKLQRNERASRERLH